MKLRKLLVLVGIVFMTTSLLVACVDKKTKPREEIKMTQEEKKKIRKQQETLALFIINNFEGIEKIEFTDISGGGFGQLRTIKIEINDELVMHADLVDSYEMDHITTFTSDEKLPKMKSQKSNFKNLDDINVIVEYSKEDENDTYR